MRVLVSGGECDSAASSLSGVGVVGPACSQELSVLTRSAPSSVDSSATGTVRFARALGVTVRSLYEHNRALLAVTAPGVIVRGHLGPATDLVTITRHGTGCFSLLTSLGHGIEVGSLGGVAGIEWRLLVPPRIVATQGQGWSLPLRLRAAPSPCPRLTCRTLPGCSSACQGPMSSGTLWWALHFRLLPSLVPGCCLALLLRIRQQPLCMFICECSRSGCGFSRWCCLCNRFGWST